MPHTLNLNFFLKKQKQKPGEKERSLTREAGQIGGSRQSCFMSRPDHPPHVAPLRCSLPPLGHPSTGGYFMITFCQICSRTPEMERIRRQYSAQAQGEEPPLSFLPLTFVLGCLPLEWFRSLVTGQPLGRDRRITLSPHNGRLIQAFYFT